MHIGEKIKARRKELKLSQRELSERMGYQNHSTIARIESGKVDVPQSRIVKFADVLNVDITYLMDFDAAIKADPVGLAERHFEIIMDEDFTSIFDDFKNLNSEKKQVVKDFVRVLADKKAEV